MRRCAVVLGVAGWVGLGGLLVLNIATGMVSLSLSEVATALIDPAADPVHRQIVWELRLPRGLVAAVAGALLGLSGAFSQIALRNPLAEPSLTGVVAGGAFATALWIGGGGRIAEPSLVLPAVACAGGLMGGALVYGMAMIGGRGAEPVRLILIGVVVSAMFQTLTSLIMIRGNAALGSLLTWLIGSLNGRVWVHWNVLWPWAGVVIPCSLALVKTANTLLLSDDVVRELGVNVSWARLLCLGAAAMTAAGAVAIVGAVGFVGLMSPHIARRVIGSDARLLLPFSLLIGAIVLLGADTLAQAVTINPPFTATSYRVGLPVGAVTALLGAPWLLYLIRKTI